MIILTAAALGIIAGLTRSAFSIALIAALIAVTFAAAALVSAGPVSAYHLFYAIIGYNSGLVGYGAALYAIDRFRVLRLSR
jgi:hypothetical protein